MDIETVIKQLEYWDKYGQETGNFQYNVYTNARDMLLKVMTERDEALEKRDKLRKRLSIERKLYRELKKAMDSANEKLAATESHAAPSHSKQSESHEWDNQDKCKKCGDRDWYAGPLCSVKPVDSEARTKYGFYTENYDGLPSIETLGTGDGKTLFSVLTYDDEKKTGLGLGYGRGKGVGVIVENVAQLDRHEAGITHQVKFESVGTIDSLMFILCQIREKQEAYCADRCPIHESEQSEPTKNQCDGCSVGDPINDHGNHVSAKNVPYMGCQKSRYDSPAPDSEGE